MSCVAVKARLRYGFSVDLSRFLLYKSSRVPCQWLHDRRDSAGLGGLYTLLVCINHAPCDQLLDRDGLGLAASVDAKLYLEVVLSQLNSSRSLPFPKNAQVTSLA